MKFRAIAREAVVSALIGLLLGEIAALIFGVREARQIAKSAAFAALHAAPPAPDLYVVDNSIKVPLHNGTVLWVADCAQVHAKDDIFDRLAREVAADIRGVTKPKEQVLLDFSKAVAISPGTISDDCVIFRDVFAKYGGHMTEAPLGDLNQVAIEKQYWEFYLASRNHSLTDTIPVALIFGLIGLPTGLVIWMFYRLVRFAVKG